MKRALILLLACCTLDPVGVLNRAALWVHAFDLPEGGELKLSTTDSTQQTRVKTTPVTKQTMRILYEEGSLAEGSVSISAELRNADDQLIGCGTARGVVGQDEDVVIGFASPSVSALNCGTCGNRCETDVSTAACIAGVCSNWECAPGLVNPQADGGGCTEPMMMMPDAGPMPDAGSDGGVNDAGVPDSGVVCMPSAEDSEATCSDGADNNCDARTDCADPGCGGLTRACTVAGCGRPGVQTWSCTTRTWGTCTGDETAENTVANCRDGIDNDCDMKTDCADENCADIKVGCGVDICAAGLRLWNCSTNSFGLCLPYIPLPENNGLLCGNNLDDDCDGKTDCSDMSCRGRGCGLGKICCADGGCATGC